MPAWLSRRVGPWPVWAWLAIIAAGVGVGLLLRRFGFFGVGADAEEPSLDDVDIGAPGVEPSVLERPTLPIGTVPLPVVPPPVVQTPTRPQTNDEWARVAIEWLIANRVEPNVADSAIRKYLQGVALTVAETGALNLALRNVGSPPEGVPPVQTPGLPTPPTPGTTLPAPQLRLANAVRTGLHWRWNPVAGAAGYRLRWVIGTSRGSRTTLIGFTGRLEYVRHGLRPNTHYGLRVAAVDPAGRVGKETTVIGRTTR